MKFTIQVDGQTIYTTDCAQDIKVIAEGAFSDDEKTLDVHTTFTPEGVVMDAVQGNEIVASSLATYEELLQEMEPCEDGQGEVTKEELKFAQYIFTHGYTSPETIAWFEAIEQASNRASDGTPG